MKKFGRFAIGLAMVMVAVCLFIYALDISGAVSINSIFDTQKQSPNEIEPDSEVFEEDNVFTEEDLSDSTVGAEFEAVEEEEEESYIGKQIVFDGWGYTLKSFWFSDSLPDGVTISDCPTGVTPNGEYVSAGGLILDDDGYPISYDEYRRLLASDFMDENGVFDVGACPDGIERSWIFIEIDMQNITEKATMVALGSGGFKLDCVSNGNVYITDRAMDWLNLHNNGGVVPDELTGEGLTILLDYGYNVVCFDVGETRTLVFGWLLSDNFIGENVTYYLTLGTMEYHLKEQYNYAVMYLR